MLVLLDTREVIDGELRLGGLRLVDNVDAGDWVVAGTHGWSVVHQLVPEVFEAYARVFHLAYRQVEDDEETQTYAPTSGGLIPGTTRAVTVYGREVRWAEVTEANRRVAHPAMEWASIAGDHGFRCASPATSICKAHTSGGSAESVQQLVDDAQLEVLTVGAQQSLAMDADTINPEPKGEYRG